MNIVFILSINILIGLHICDYIYGTFSSIVPAIIRNKAGIEVDHHNPIVKVDHFKNIIRNIARVISYCTGTRV